MFNKRNEYFRRGEERLDRGKIAEQLVALRGDKKQEEIAKELGVTVASISDYEEGIRIPNDALKIKMADYYGTTVEQLFF